MEKLLYMEFREFNDAMLHVLIANVAEIGRYLKNYDGQFELWRTSNDLK